MRNISLFSLLAIILPLLALTVSCGSAPPPAPPVPPAAPEEPAVTPVAPEPEPEPPVVVETPAGPTAEEQYAELLLRMEAARDHARDAGAEEAAPEEFASAENSTGLASDNARDNDYETAIQNLEEAIILFDQAGKNAIAEWENRIAQAKQTATGQKAAADEVKAGNAAKPEYLEAERLYQAGEHAAAAKDYRNAIAQYESAAQKFGEAAQIAADKRAAAAAALLAAEKKVAESDAIAADVEQTLIETGAE